MLLDVIQEKSSTRTRTEKSREWRGLRYW